MKTAVKFVGYVLILFACNTLFAQKDTISINVNDTLIRKSLVDSYEDLTQLDTLYSLYLSRGTTKYWKVYDSKDSILIQEHYCDKDTCHFIYYRFDGSLKWKVIETVQDGLLYEWYYCENGDVIFEREYKREPTLITLYFCNGRKQAEYIIDYYKVTGRATFWYEHGEIRALTNYDQDGNEDGDWTFFDEKGNLVEEKKYLKGELMNSIKY